MMNRNSRLWWQILSASFVIFLLSFVAMAEIDPNPDSPTPVLISESKDSLRALATSPDRLGRTNLSSLKSRAFMPNSRVVLYATNFEFLADEGANSVRLYVEDAKGRKYRLSLIHI